MPELALYFNEHSSPPDSVSGESLEHWKGCVKELALCLARIMAFRGECSIVFAANNWNASMVGKPLSVWVRDWIDRDLYRRLIGKMHDVGDTHDLCCEVQIQGEKAVGLTLASLADTWAFSFPVIDSNWRGPNVTAPAYCLDETGETVVERDIRHVSLCEHASYWREKLIEWGKTISRTCEIAVVAGHSVVMYQAPREHGYPHVHLVCGQKGDTIAKYRVDTFVRMQGPPKYDAEMRSLIEEYRQQLLESWERCQRGRHPYRIA